MSGFTFTPNFDITNSHLTEPTDNQLPDGVPAQPTSEDLAAYSDQELAGLINSMEDLLGVELSPKWTNIIGNKTLNDGGYFGDIMQVIRVHVQRMLTDQQLKQSTAGEVISSTINAGLSQAINYELTKHQNKYATMKALQDALLAELAVRKNKIEISQLNSTATKAYIESLITGYTYESILPAERGLKVEQINLTHAQHEAAKADAYFKGFKAEEEAIRAGRLPDGTVDHSQSQPKYEMDNLQSQNKIYEAQATLYGRQTEAFDERKLEKLLELQLNYQSMLGNFTAEPLASNPAFDASAIAGVYEQLGNYNKPL